MVYDEEAFENTKQGQYAKECTTKEVYLPGCSADDQGQISFPVKDKTYKQVHVPTGLSKYFKTKSKKGASEDDAALLADDGGTTEDPVLWGDETLAAMDKQEEDQAQQDQGQAETEAPGESGGQEDEVTVQDFVPEDYWEVRGLYIYRVHKKMRTKTFAPTECEDAPPIPLQNLEVYRTTIPDKFSGYLIERIIG